MFLTKQKSRLQTIYVAIPDLDDTETLPTVQRLFKNAEHPERIHVGVAFQSLSSQNYEFFLRKTKKYKKRISAAFFDFNTKNLADHLGVGRGRKLSHSFYNGEDYVLQIDSHTLVAKDWDTTLISLHKKAQTIVPHKKVLITGYAGTYAYTGKRKISFVDGDGHLFYPMFDQEVTNTKKILSWKTAAGAHGRVRKGFCPALKFSANFTFGDKEFAKNLGLAEEATFWEEEVLQSVNLYADNFAFVFPVLSEPLVCHLYYGNITEFGGARSNIFNYYRAGGINDDSSILRNYVRFVNDPANAEKIRLYEEYANVDLKNSIVDETYVPSNY